MAVVHISLLGELWRFRTATFTYHFPTVLFEPPNPRDDGYSLLQSALFVDILRQCNAETELRAMWGLQGRLAAMQSRVNEDVDGATGAEWQQQVSGLLQKAEGWEEELFAVNRSIGWHCGAGRGVTVTKRSRRINLS